MTERREHARRIPPARVWIPIEPTPCAIHPDGWHPDTSSSERWPIQICDSCPVRSECLRASFDQAEEYGTWGGVTAHQRQIALRARRGDDDSGT